MAGGSDNGVRAVLSTAPAQLTLAGGAIVVEVQPASGNQSVEAEE